MQPLDHHFVILELLMDMHEEKSRTLRDLFVPRVQIYDLLVYLVVLVVFGLRLWPFWVRA